MQWKKFQKGIGNYIHPLFKGKIKFEYNGGWSNKFQILFENKILATYISDHLHFYLDNKYTPIILDDFGESLKIMHEIMEVDLEKKLYDPSKIANIIIEVFTNMSIKEALNSNDKFVRAIALMDKRCGSKTFKNLDYSIEEDFLLRNIYNLRKYLENKNKRPFV